MFPINDARSKRRLKSFFKVVNLPLLRFVNKNNFSLFPFDRLMLLKNTMKRKTGENKKYFILDKAW